jgi:hypothetical protein
MTIDASGSVDTLKLIHSDLVDADFQSCVLDQIKSSHVVVTPERLGVIISHRFRFTKKQLDKISFEE